jgi:hypothetical protein
MPRGIFKRKIKPIICFIGPSIAYVTLTRGRFTCISTDDIPEIGRFNWCVLLHDGREYAVKRDGDNFVYMHRVLKNVTDPEIHIDHKNGNGLHNFPSNIRCANRFGNMQNVGKFSTNTTGFKGVCYHKLAGKWMASISGKYLGLFPTPELAHAAYCEAAARLHGEFARTS